jgi:hypothetical protein
MMMGVSAGAQSRAAGRIAVLLSLAAALAIPVAAAAQGSGTPPITIPPAQLPPLAPTPPAPAAPPPPAATAPATATTIQPAASSLLPSSVQILHDPQGGGIVMYGALTGKAASALGVALGVFGSSQAFDPVPAPQLALADQGDRHAQALFTGTVRGAPVIGVAVVSLSDTGGDVSVFYDYADAFAASFARMQQALGQSGGAGTVALSPIRLGDGNRIDIPPGWRVTGQGKDLVDLRGAQGESMSLGAALPAYSPGLGLAGYVQAPCCDPVKAFQAVFPQVAAIDQRLGLPRRQLVEIVETQPTPVSDGGEGAFILSNTNVGGQPYSYFALVDAVAGFTDPWTFRLSGTMAPQPVFAEDLPTLLRIWQSYSGNPPAFADRLQQALRGMETAQQIIQSTITARETAEYNASAGWDQVIRGTATSGGQVHIADSLAQPLVDKLSADTGRPWRIVPLAELK